jgi:hypothetical protein
MQILLTIPDDPGGTITAVRVVGSTLPPVEDWRTETGFPKIKEFDGVAIMMAGPANPSWKPSMAAHLFGQQGAHVADPSYPPGARSPAGFPMNNGRILYFDGMYTTDADVFTAIGQDRAQAQAAIDQALSKP